MKRIPAKTKLEFTRASIQVGQLRIDSDGRPENTVILLDGKPRSDIGRIEITIDARIPLAAISVVLVPPSPPKEAA